MVERQYVAVSQLGDVGVAAMDHNRQYGRTVLFDFHLTHEGCLEQLPNVPNPFLLYPFPEVRHEVFGAILVIAEARQQELNKDLLGSSSC